MGEVRYEPRVRLLKGDGVDTSDLLQRCGNTVLEKPKERLDGRESDITARGLVLPICFEMLQEVGDQRSVDLLEIKLRRTPF